MVAEETVEATKKPSPVFKNPNFQEKFRPITVSGKKRTWKSLKQILTQERSLPWPADAVHCKKKNKIIIIQLIHFESQTIDLFFFFYLRQFHKCSTKFQASKKVLRHFWPPSKYPQK